MSLTMAPVEETLHRALNYKAEGLYDEAIELFRICLDRDPGNGVAHMELGLVYGFVGLFDESVEELESAVNLAPEQLDCRWRRTS